jgi:Contractile injection system tube protein/LysM domain
MAPVKATLEVIEGSNKGVKVTVHFNPQSLRVTYRTAGTTGKLAKSQQTEKQEATAQQTGFGSGLSVELLFDTSQSGEDVRNTTLKIARMMQPEVKDSADTAPAVPLVRFSWGTFLFHGNIQSMDETLDLFSEQGVPLRATVSLSMNEVALGNEGSSPGAAGTSSSAGEAVGTTPLTLSQAGDTLQSLAARAGIDWKAVGNANNVDNPRHIVAGTVLNLRARFR